MTEQESVQRRRWIILILICLINLCAGSVYAWSVLSAAAAESLTALTGTPVTPGDLAIAFGVANSVGPIPMILGGAVNDRFGPRFVIMTGGLLIGVGLALCGILHSVAGITLAFGGFFGIGLGLAYGAGIATVVKYFPERRGFAGGIVTAAYGFSSVIVPPAAHVLISAFGVMQTFVILGTVFGAVIAVCGFFCSRCPDGFVPAGVSLPPRAAAEGKNWREMLSSPVFWPMLALLMCGAVTGMMILSQAAFIARQEIGMTPAAAAGAVSVIALFNMAGRLLAGTLSDRLGRIGVLAFGLVFSAAGLFTLMTAGKGDTALFYGGCVLVGIAFGAFMAVYPGFTADRFGARNAGVNYGIMFCGFALAGMIGPALMRSLQASGFAFADCCLAGIGFCTAGLLFAFVCSRFSK